MTEVSAAAKSSLELSNLPRAVVPHIDFSTSKTEERIQIRYIWLAQSVPVAIIINSISSSALIVSAAPHWRLRGR